MAKKDLSLQEAAEIVGVHVKTLKRWIKKGKFTVSYQIGGTVRVPAEALDAIRFKQGKGVEPCGE